MSNDIIAGAGPARHDRRRTQTNTGLILWLACSLPLILLGSSTASAHCIVGNRFFPAGLEVDDPCVEDEMSLPTVDSFKNGDGADEVDIGGEYDKRITPNFGVSFEETWIHLKTPGGGTEAGFDNLGTGFTYQVFKDPASEFAMTATLDVDWGGTGSKKIDAESFTTLTPTMTMGKGFNFMPDSLRLFRPFAITGAIGYAVPTQSSSLGIDEVTGLATLTPNAQVLEWGGTLQYSMQYLKSSVRDYGLPDFINRMVPLVEVSLETDINNYGPGDQRTTGTINPGLIYVGDKYQLAAEAILPINRESGDGVGVIGQVHLYLDDIFPNSLGKPLFAGPSD